MRRTSEQFENSFLERIYLQNYNFWSRFYAEKLEQRFNFLSLTGHKPDQIVLYITPVKESITILDSSGELIFHVQSLSYAEGWTESVWGVSCDVTFPPHPGTSQFSPSKPGEQEHEWLKMSLWAEHLRHNLIFCDQHFQKLHILLVHELTPQNQKKIYYLIWKLRERKSKFCRALSAMNEKTLF